MIRKRKYQQGVRGYGGGLYPYYGFGQVDDDLRGEDVSMTNNLGEQFDGMGDGGGGDGGGGGE